MAFMHTPTILFAGYDGYKIKKRLNFGTTDPEPENADGISACEY